MAASGDLAGRRDPGDRHPVARTGFVTRPRSWPRTYGCWWTETEEFDWYQREAKQRFLEPGRETLLPVQFEAHRPVAGSFLQWL